MTDFNVTQLAIKCTWIIHNNSEADIARVTKNYDLSICYL